MLGPGTKNRIPDTMKSTRALVRKRLNHMSCGASPLQIQSATYIFA